MRVRQTVKVFLEVRVPYSEDNAVCNLTTCLVVYHGYELEENVAWRLNYALLRYVGCILKVSGMEQKSWYSWKHI